MVELLLHRSRQYGKTTACAVYCGINSSVSSDVVHLRIKPVVKRYQSEAEQNQGPDVLIGPSPWIGALAPEALLRELDPFADPSTLIQSFDGRALKQTAYDGRLYGLPASKELFAPLL